MIRLFQFFLALLALIALYLFSAYLFTLFPTSPKTGIKDSSIYLYHDNHLLSHSEIIIEIAPFKERFLQAFGDLLGNNPQGYLAFSYGDRDFMMDEGGFDDINTTLALRGLFINTPALIKVGHYASIVKEKCLKIPMSQAMLNALKESILQAFKEEHGHFIPYHDRYQRYYVHYYEAKKPYNLFHTCNTWTGDRLREAGVSMPRWTPFAQSLIGYNKAKDKE